MNKSQLIDRISENSRVSKVIASRALNIMTSSIMESLKNGVHVSLMGFGTFFIKVRTSRTVKNPKTGEMIFIKRSRVPAFRAGKKLKGAVNYGD